MSSADSEGLNAEDQTALMAENLLIDTWYREMDHHSISFFVTNTTSESYRYFCEWRDNGIVNYSKLKGGRVDNYQIPGKLIYKDSGRTMMWCPVGMLI